jgi:hypothetical protein
MHINHAQLHDTTILLTTLLTTSRVAQLQVSQNSALVLLANPSFEEISGSSPPSRSIRAALLRQHMMRSLLQPQYA